MDKIDWIIHGIIDMESSYPGKPYMANFHTHGLNKHNHPELCIVLAVGIERASAILNSLGIRIAANEITLQEGIRTDILANGMNTEIKKFDNDPTLYIIFPDASGKLPSESGCEENFARQYEYAKLISDNKDYI